MLVSIYFPKPLTHSQLSMRPRFLDALNLVNQAVGCDKVGFGETDVHAALHKLDVTIASESCPEVLISLSNAEGWARFRSSLGTSAGASLSKAALPRLFETIEKSSRFSDEACSDIRGLLEKHMEWAAEHTQDSQVVVECPRIVGKLHEKMQECLDTSLKELDNDFRLSRQWAAIRVQCASC